MANFLIKRIEKDRKVKKIDKEKIGYDFKPRINSVNLEVNKITIYNSSMIDIILSKKIEKSFERVASIVYDVLQTEDDDSTSDAVMALDEVTRLREIVLNKYQKYLKKEKEKDILKKLRFLENELRSKIIIQNTYDEYLESQKGHGR